MTSSEPESSPESRGWLSGKIRRPAVSRQYIELASTILLALATIATAWSGYQSARWSGREHDHNAAAEQAIVMTAKYANLAEQKLSLQATLFAQWAGALSGGNKAFAEFFQQRFPEPLKAATAAWLATNPLTNPDAPPTPFDMPEYKLEENALVEQWERTSEAQFAEAEAAGETSDRYLMFTILFASVLFFGGVSGKFGWQALDIAVLIIGTLVLLGGLVILITAPIA